MSGESYLTLGAFQLCERVGRGGMAEVWSGIHLEQDVPVAVKVVTQDHRGAAGQLKGEVRAMAQLDHPSIVMVFDYGEVSQREAERSDGLLAHGSPYFVMELADHGTARKVCGHSDWPRMRQILLSLLDALAHAHARGVLHRDVKPSNVLLFDGGGVKLSDFGLAQPLDPDAPLTDGISEEESRIGGTPAYMSPEQFQGAWRQFDCATDLYSLGCLAFALACGRPPYGSWADLRLMARLHTRALLPPLEPVTPVPDGFEAWVRKLLQRNPGRRYQRASDAAAALVRLGEPTRVARGTLRPAPVSSPSLFTLSEIETVTASHAGFTPPVVESDPVHDSFISVAPQPLLAPSWDTYDGARPSMGLVSAGLGLYGLRSIPLVARRDERDRLWDALVRVAHEHEPRLIVLEGPAGCGKSRLAQWLCERAHETGAATVLKAIHGPRLGPGHGLSAMFARHLRTRGLHRADARALVKTVLAREGVEEDAEIDAITELVAPATEADRSSGAPTVRLSSSQERHVLIERWTQRLGMSRVVVMWLDDVQWGLDALNFVAHLMAVSHGRVLVLVTARTEALADQDLERQQLAACLTHPRATRIEVGPLPERDRATLVEGLLRLERGVAILVAQRTQGNPLFAVQLVGDWVERGLLEPSDDGFRLRPGAEVNLPNEIHQMWLGRIDRFLAGRPAEDTVALELAAILGLEVDGEEWRAACGLGGVQASTNLVEDMIARRLASTGAQGPTDSWAFSHSMLRESIERRCLDAGRLDGHHRVCAQMLRGRPGPRVAARLGHHLLAAGDLLLAIDPMRVAARRYIDIGDYAAAGRLLDHRRVAMQRLRLDEADARWGEELLLRSRMAIKRGAYDEALQRAEHAEEGARMHGWSVLLVESLMLQGDVHRLRGDLHRSEEALLLAESLARGSGEQALLAECLQVLGRRSLHAGERARAEACWREARALFEDLGDAGGAACAMWEIAHALTYSKRYDEAADLNERALADLHRLGDRWGAARSLNLRGEISRLMGDLPGAEQAYREASLVMDAIGAEDSRAICENNIARVLVERGRYREAREQLERGAAFFEQSGRKDSLAWVQTVLLCCLAAQREWAAWDARLANVRELLTASGYLDIDIAQAAQLAGELALAASQPERARDAYQVALAQWEALGRLEEAGSVRDLLRRISVG